MGIARGSEQPGRFPSTGFRIAVLASLSLSACLLGGCAGTAQGGGSADIEVDAFVRGAAPGGLTDSWVSSDGAEVVLSDDGRATMSDGRSAAASGFWRQTDATQGEVLFDDGRTLGLRLSGDDLSLYDPSAPDGTPETVFHRKGAS